MPKRLSRKVDRVTCPGIHDRTDSPRHRVLRPAARLANLFGVEMWERFSLLRHAGHPADLPVLLGRRGRARASTEATADRHRRRLRRRGLPRPRSSAPGSPTGCSAPERTLFYSAVVVMLGHIALVAPPGLRRGRRRPGAHRVRQRRREGQRDLAGRHALRRARRPRRDAGFSLFYLGINLGAFVGPLLTGLLQTTSGFHWGFGAGRGRHGDRADAVLLRPQAACPTSRTRRPEPAAREPAAAGTSASRSPRSSRDRRRWR